jgi:alkanesulfonate monooxygenase SsuD/methylene tetrahydromethanopterin reductase-like flavin-dependent oxidoreductase (luciferase family)
MEIGVHFIDFLPGDPAKLVAMGRAEDPFLEGYTSLGFLAGQTTTIDLTLLVTGVMYRYPGILAKTLATLDILSGGRSMFGIGAAW